MEYACRAGTPTAFSFGDDPRQLGAYAWYEGNASGGAHRVGEKQPNPWGLYDVHGNVWQWCHDWYEKDYKNSPRRDPRRPDVGADRVLRGGSYGCAPRRCRAAVRAADPPSNHWDYLGFRVVRLW